MGADRTDGLKCRLSLTQADFDRFASLSRDDNPIHVDPGFSARTRFGRTVAHGMLLYARISSCVNAYLPGSYQVSQELLFPGPTYAGDDLHIELTIDAAGTARGTTRIESLIIRSDGVVTCQGATEVARLPYEPIKISEAGDSPGSEAHSMKGLELGQGASFRRVFTSQDLADYCELSAEESPLYRDEVYARENGFVSTPVPGALLGGAFSYLLGTRLPGRGTNWLKQKLFFDQPLYPGEEMLARVEVVRLRPEKDLVNLRTTAESPTRGVICLGEALVLVKDLEY